MGYGSLYHEHVTKGYAERGQSASALTGTVAAAADGTIWTFRYPETTPMPGASRKSGKRLLIQRIELQYTTVTAFGTPVTAGRALRLVRGAPTSGTASNPSGGAAVTAVRKRSDLSDETLGVGRIATTGVLTTTGITFETSPLRRVVLVGYGTAGATYSKVWRFDGTASDPVYLLPGQLIAIATDAAFDATGTFQLGVDVDAVEIVGV